MERQIRQCGIHSVLGFLCAVSLTLSSIYVFPSGLPQPADGIWLLFFAVSIISVMSQGFAVPFPHPVRVWLLLCITVVLVSGYWFSVTQDAEFLKPPLFWIYNFIVGWALLIFIRRSGDKGLKWLRIGVLLGLLVSAVGVFVNLGSSVRSVGWFNNPNQLAYHSICLGGMMLLLDAGQVKFKGASLLAYLSVIIGILAASSIAGFGGLVLLICGVLLASGFRVKRMAGLAVVLVVLMPLIGAVSLVGEGVIVESVKVRLDRMESKVEDAGDERRLYRIVEFPEMNVLGAGEGGYYRFGPNESGEMHSSLGTLLFSYGFAGLALFLGLVWSVARRSPVWIWFVIGAPLFYSLTHMGLRFTVFWLLLVVAYELGGRSWEGSVRSDFPSSEVKVLRK